MDRENPYQNENYPYVAAMAIGCALVVGGFVYLFSDHDMDAVNRPAFPESAQESTIQPSTIPPSTTGQGPTRVR